MLLISKHSKTTPIWSAACIPIKSKLKQLYIYTQKKENITDETAASIKVEEIYNAEAIWDPHAGCILLKHHHLYEHVYTPVIHRYICTLALVTQYGREISSISTNLWTAMDRRRWWVDDEASSFGKACRMQLGGRSQERSKGSRLGRLGLTMANAGAGHL